MRFFSAIVLIILIILTSAFSARAGDPPDAYRYWTFVGDSEGDRFGAAVLILPDQNGDGHAELLIGAPEGRAYGQARGTARIYSGRTGQALKTHEGAADGDEFGFAVAVLWDINLDGVHDYAIGAPGGGYVRVCSGKKNKELHTIYSPVASEARFGHALSLDVLGSVAVGAPLDDTFGTDAGSVRVYDDIYPVATLPGQQPGELFGWAFHWAHDVAGYEYFAHIVGAPNHYHSGDHHGKVYVMGNDGSGPHVGWIGSPAGGPAERLGSAVHLARWTDPIFTEPWWRIFLGAPGEGAALGYVKWMDPWPSPPNVKDVIWGLAPGDGFGSAIASVGYVSSKPEPLFAAGAPLPGTVGAGTVRVVTMQSGEDVYWLTGSTPAGEFGAALSGEGDVDGDGWRDLLVGEPGAGPGAAYVYRLDQPIVADKFVPGDVLAGVIADAGDEDDVYFEAVKGFRFRLWAQGVAAPLDLKVRLYDPKGNEAASWKIGAGAEPEKRKTKLKKTGTWRLAVTSWKGATGEYRLLTEYEAPKSSSSINVKGKASKKTGALRVEFVGVIGTSLHLDAEPTKSTAGVPTLKLVNPDGTKYRNLQPYYNVLDNWASWWNVPLEQTGKYTALIHPAHVNDKVAVGIELYLPTGQGVTAID